MDWNFGEEPKPGAETALDACDYFVEEVKEVTSSSDAREQVQAIKHKELREAVVAGDERAVRVLLEALGCDRHIIVNMAPSGANTLLFVASQSGFENITKRLLEAGSDGRSHSVTKYTPLYAAVQHGYCNIAKLLLDAIPELVKQPSIEQWLPLHAACINGHIKAVELILNYNYPDNLYNTYRDEDCIWEWQLPFDPNHQDISGQTCLYIACILGNSSLVNILLNWKVESNRIVNDKSSVSSTRKRISFGIQAIMSKLNISAEEHLYIEEAKCEKCPVNVNLLCGAARETALLAAVRGGFVDVVYTLLQHGANPNIIAKPGEGQNDSKCVEEVCGICNIAITEACKQGSLPLLDMLLDYGARDDFDSALNIAVNRCDEAILSRLLAKRVHPDSDYKINKKVKVCGSSLSTSIINDNTIYPKVPTIIDWHINNNIQLSYIRIDWMINGVLQMNPELRGQPKMNELALNAITRIDLSHNNLTSIPFEIFTLGSLRSLNAAQNKLTSLPTSSNEKKTMSCPVLEEIYLQDNRLTSIPAEIFKIPALSVLDLSNNKLQEIPFEMWMAPKLRELNIAFNLLKELPIPPLQPSSSQTHLNKIDYEPFSQLNSLATRKNKPHVVVLKPLIHRNIWSNTVEITDQDLKWNESRNEEGVSQLNSLNIANNLFTSIPAALPCLGINLTRLNMSYNSLRSMGHVTSYPSTIKQLDLSHNEISCWPSLPRITDSDPHLFCYNFTEKPKTVFLECEQESFSKTDGNNKSSSFRSTVMKSVCCHRRHLRLESLRTLILADNLLTRIQLSTDDIPTILNEYDDWTTVGFTKSKLVFPNLSMLDISNNCLKEIPPCLHELSSLSVLNISGNVDITDIPPKLGLLSRLWNLNTRGCLLQDPLKSMIESKKYKTMDIVGYLKSIYEDAQPYRRMKLMVVGVHDIGKTTLLGILTQGGSHKTRMSDNHWARRMGHTKNVLKTSRKANISTVGVDIGTWVCESRKQGPGSYGPVVFRTWDFGGQTEYYATHQYFLSKRSLYLVLWKITDGHKGLAGILQWLGNIQARAPNSAVIIVGTHFDAVGESFSYKKAEELQQTIRERFIAIPDAEKIGLPRVIDSVEISCRTHHNIRLLSNIIYDTAFTLRSPGSKGSLLLQKVPASYIALEDVVSVISSKLKAVGLDPVLNTERYKNIVTEEMRVHNYKHFRDAAELNQATMFLHDNGVILHYDDATLRDFYFLDPQWLCDMLAHVVTVREINPFAKSGVMKLDDLQLLFRNTNSSGNNDRSYIVNLLNKFEVALTWDSKTLLIPSLLPLNEDVTLRTTVKISQRTRGRVTSLDCSISNNIKTNKLYFEPYRKNYEYGIRRILLMTYFPSGFWSRLLTRLLADEQITEAIRIAFNENSVDFDLKSCIEQETKWNLWQKGLSLYLGNVLLMKLWEVPYNENSLFRRSGNVFKLKQDGIWNDVNLANSSILELYFPLLSAKVYHEIDDNIKEAFATIDLNRKVVYKLLALSVDHIDLLLEDWYPSLGTRFVHTSEGRFLITRLVLCPKCLLNTHDSDIMWHGCTNQIQTKGRLEERSDGVEAFDSDCLSTTRTKNSQNSLHYTDTDSGIGPDSAGSSRRLTLDEHPIFKVSETSGVCYTWMIEECILSIYNQTKISCPLHLEINMVELAPDVIFSDIPEKFAIDPESIVKGALLGRGAFGFVFKALCRNKNDGSFRSVAMKMLQPVVPGHKAKESALMALKIAKGKWDRDPLQHSCKAYCTARQELAVLLTLQHSNIVSLVGICIKPLALVLDFAPKGGLDLILRQYRRSGAHIGPVTFQILVLQAARAIEYLHRKRIIYRDLKSENVLVWNFPQPHSEDSQKKNVLIKLADYGISRLSSPSGSKGFGGTEGFMAPEIIRFNGEEEYTEKVDCFSFGMFMYENISLRQPFEGQDSIKECILEGWRPKLTPRETQFPTYFLDLMVLCWDELPKNRPSGSQIVSMLSSPECIHLLDVIVLPLNEKVVCGAIKTLLSNEDDTDMFELWLPTFNSKINILDGSYLGKFLQCSNIHCEDNNHLKVSPEKVTNKEQTINMLCCCMVEDSAWIGDSTGYLHVYSTSSYTHVFSYLFDSSIRSPIISLVYLENVERVAVGSQNGRIFLVDSTKVPTNCTFAEGSFVLNEICSGQALHCSVAVFDKTYELWCGENEGRIYIFPLSKCGASGHQVVYHDVEPISDVKVTRLCSNNTYVYSCLHTGFAVYQWNSKTRVIENKLDCSKLLPCSESLKSMSIDDHLSLIKCQISALATYRNELYIGTTWGCLIIADLKNLRPLSVFRPYETEIKAIIPVPSKTMPFVATLGHRYRSLISRYMDNEESNFQLNKRSFENKQSLTKASRDLKNNVHCLLWYAENWT